MTKKLLHELREASGMSAQAIAVAAGLHANTVERVLADNPVPPASPESVAAVERVLQRAVKANKRRAEKLLAKLTSPVAQ